MQNYSNLTDKARATLLYQHYIEENKSYQEIAEMYDTYPNRIRRDAKKYGLKSRSKSEAQKLALESGKHKHPTKGTTRDEKTKSKIGNSVMKSWENISSAELERRQEIARQNWEKLSEDEKNNRLQEANAAIRRTSKSGSKLEKFLHLKLLEVGYRVETHKEQILSGTKLHIDLFLPKTNIAIEVDGPSHFAPVWGKKTLERNKAYDNKKHGLLIGKGIKLIRIKQTKDFSKARSNLIFEKLLDAIKNIKDYTQIGDE